MLEALQPSTAIGIATSSDPSADRKGKRQEKGRSQFAPRKDSGLGSVQRLPSLRDATRITESGTGERAMMASRSSPLTATHASLAADPQPATGIGVPDDGPSRAARRMRSGAPRTVSPATM